MSNHNYAAIDPPPVSQRPLTKEQQKERMLQMERL